VQSQDSLARGALRAAASIERQPPGLFSMREVLGLLARRPRIARAKGRARWDAGLWRAH
jgi:hypothetical protein